MSHVIPGTLPLNLPGRKAWQGLRIVARFVTNVLVLLMALAGLANLVSVTVQDGQLPSFTPLSAHARRAVFENRTAFLGEHALPSEYWSALQPTMRLVDEISVPIGGWVRRLQRETRIHYQPLPIHAVLSSRHDVLAAYDANFGTLTLAPGFWQLTDGEKATVLAHEYRHARQNRAKIIASAIVQFLNGGMFQYGSPLEDEAHLYQLEAYRALGMAPERIRDYLGSRNLFHTVATTP
jgi:hypothetical protein